jgi:hypothetical protein
MTTLEKLSRLKHFHTRYEVTATQGDRKVLIGYTPRKGRRGIWSILSGRAESWGRFVGHADPQIQFRKPSSAGADSEGWHINFSGRTQREAIIAGELPFFPYLVESKEVESISVPSGKIAA